MSESRHEARIWLRLQGRLGRRAAMPATALGLLAIALAIGQALCAAGALDAALAHQAPPVLLLAGFAALALLRAGCAPTP
jgi:hypothetical protein